MILGKQFMSENDIESEKSGEEVKNSEMLEEVQEAPSASH